MTLRIIITFAILIGIDLYAFQAIRTVFPETKWIYWVYWISSGGLLAYLLYIILNFDRSAGPASISSFIGLMVLFSVPKMLLIVFLIGEDLWRLIEGVGKSVIGSSSNDGFIPSRRRFVSQTALIVSAIPFAGIIHGIWKGKYNYRVIKKTIVFDNLPKEFDGFTLTQISDVHSGSFDNAEKIKYGLDLINEQKSDVIIFTGDLVNNTADEMKPWEAMFSELHAEMGKYSILGNHDYGDYVKWNSPKEKQENLEELYRVHERIGFKLLRNENLKLYKKGASIDLVGVENWGKGFAQHGDLDKASKNLSPESFKILMSHDPSHFDEIAKIHPKNFDITFSGHTHGMQFGIEIPGWIKWSPVKFRYPKWAGLYTEESKHLYVNRGFGFLAFPGRVGIWPEITVIEFKSNQV